MPGVKRYRLPLLPFERELIELAGITEDEYRYFVAESLERAKIRPAEYDIIPDIRCDPVTLTTIFINIAVGLALSAITYLLTPKPKDTSIQRRELASITGQSVFAPTSGFDSLAALANYNEPIPLIFGRYTGTTGGILISPKLVWSRAFSYGIEQGVKLLFAVGEQGAASSGIPQPDLAGIFLGNSPLDAAFDHKFAFYWRSGTVSGTSRIKAADLRYGTRGTPESGDPENNDDIFVAPTRVGGLTDQAFCMAYAPTSNAQFGAFSPVINATDYRTPWKLVPTPNIPDSDADPRSQLTLERIKIAGQYGIPFSRETRLELRNRGQAGIGRAYSRRMGITAIDGFNATSPTAIEDVSISVGSTCVFTIHEDSLPLDLYQGDATDAADSVQVGDINSELESQRFAADSILQIGETIQIGHTLWLVYHRSLAVWQPGQRQSISLRCIEILDSLSSLSRRIGRVGFTLLNSGITSAGAVFPATDEGAYAIVPTTYYPLMRTQIAMIRNTRPCDTTEIGIRSQVWNRASGLCNFQSLPTPTAFRDNEINRVAITSGTMTRYFKRTSVFALQLRPAGNDPNGNAYDWVGIGINFCVTGDQPLDLYNYIKIEHAERRQYEFRLVPRTGADVIRNLGATTQLWRLDARRSNSIIIRNVGTPSYGSFRVIAPGETVTVQDVRRNAEFEAQGRTFENNSQLADVSHYSGAVQKSNESQPEHAISYVNEITRNTDGIPQYTSMVTAGLAIKASRTYTSIDQIRVWKDNGIPVQRFHPDDGGTIGPSNLLTDLVYYLLTDRVAGAGASVSAALIKTSDFAGTARFLRTNKLFFDGVIVDPVNIREFITSTAPFFLCNFVISDGLLSLVPAVPTTSSGGISTGAVPISAMFTQGNIIEDTFRVEYINAEERNNIQAVLRYREGVKNQLPQERTTTVRWNSTGSANDKIETFDLTQYCTSRDHAILAGRFLLSVRRRITHTVTFKTTPQGLSLSPGDYIRVITTASPYSGANNGIVTETGVIVSATPLANGTYTVNTYRSGDDNVVTQSMIVSNGATTSTNTFNTVFTVVNASTSSNVYLVEQLSLDAESMVEIVASEFPCTTALVSQIALDLTTSGSFIVEG